MTHATIVCVPTYNERDNVPWLLARLFQTSASYHVLIVDDASPDGTAAIVRRICASDDRVHLLERRGKHGLGSAYLEAFAWALRHPYARVVQMDADLSHDPADIPRLLEALDNGSDVAIGSRYVDGGAVHGWGRVRRIVSQGGSLYARTVLGLGVRDMTSGFKAWSRDALERVDLSAVRSNGYAFQVEMTARALRAGLRVCEVPTVFVDRRAGRSKMNLRIIFEASWRVPWLRFFA